MLDPFFSFHAFQMVAEATVDADEGVFKGQHLFFAEADAFIC